MTLIGYTMMGEQAGPKKLVRDVALAEEAGFDFAVISDHYFPWLDAQVYSIYGSDALGAPPKLPAEPLDLYTLPPVRHRAAALRPVSSSLTSHSLLRAASS